LKQLDVRIPFADAVFLDQSRFPHEILVVVTRLSPADPEANEMLKATSEALALRQLQSYRIHWNDKGDRPVVAA
jgi:hypothetical protein